MPDRWPLLMSLTTACRYLSYSQHQFRALMASGAFPKPIEQIPGVYRWNRLALDRAVERLDKPEATIDAEREQEATRRAIAQLRYDMQDGRRSPFCSTRRGHENP